MTDFKFYFKVLTKNLREPESKTKRNSPTVSSPRLVAFLGVFLLRSKLPPQTHSQAEATESTVMPPGVFPFLL